MERENRNALIIFTAIFVVIILGSLIFIAYSQIPLSPKEIQDTLIVHNQNLESVEGIKSILLSKEYNELSEYEKAVINRELTEISMENTRKTIEMESSNPPANLEPSHAKIVGSLDYFGSAIESMRNYIKTGESNYLSESEEYLELSKELLEESKVLIYNTI